MRILRWGALLALLLCVTAPASAADRTCSSSSTLDALVDCIRSQMPGSGSYGFIPPTATQQSDWRWTVRQMLAGSCDFQPPASLSGIVQIRTFTDSGNGKRYCLLMEVRDADGNGIVDRGWGTFVVDPLAERELSHQAPHPIYDSTTENQAVDMFRDTNSRSYLVCGAHRNANPVVSTCQSGYNQADCAHNTNNMFHATNEELQAFYAGRTWNAIQWHGMAADTCPSVNAYLSHGMNQLPAAGDKIAVLKNNILQDHPTWSVQTTGTGACTLNATDNVQGRLLNGVLASSVCNTAASMYTGTFIHNEQDPGFRTASDWVSAVADTWPLQPSTPPAAPAGLSAAAAKRKVTLSWSASTGAETYRVKRATTNGGPYAVISGSTSTNFTDTGVKSGVTYYYVVSAVNTFGESPDSVQVSARPK